MASSEQQELIDWLENASSIEMHQVAAGWNWDSGNEVLAQLIQNPRCDKGTALMLYWHGSPAFFTKFSTRAEVPSFALNNFDFLKDLESRYLSGFYQLENIRFDPRNDDEEYDWTEEIDLEKVKVAIPDEMMKATQGQVVERDRENYEDGWPMDVYKKVFGDN